MTMLICGEELTSAIWPCAFHLRQECARCVCLESIQLSQKTFIEIAYLNQWSCTTENEKAELLISAIEW